jgi:uncharacterized membrane protein YgcG
VIARIVIVVLVGVVVASFVLGQFLPSGSGQFPQPVVDQAVYDEAGVLTEDDEAALEAQIDALEARSGAEVAIYLQVDPSQDFDTNLALAEALMNEWGVGREGYDDGFVILISFQDDRIHGVLSTYAGSGFKVAYLSEDEQTAMRDQVMVPYFQAEQVGDGLLAAMGVIADEVTPGATAALNLYRQANAVIGIPGGILVLLFTLGTAFVVWRRQGDDPDVIDSPSVLMAGPPADMTPPLATVLTEGRATGNAIRTLMVELAGTGLIRFRNLERVKDVKRDDDPDPLTDPAIEIVGVTVNREQPTGVLAEAFRELVTLGGSTGELRRESLWAVNETLEPTKRRLEEEGVRLGWLTRRPTPEITKWIGIGVLEAIAGGGAIFLGYAIPMSGLTLVGGALVIGGLATAAFGTQMSKRTENGAYVDAMLKAFRRTLQKTLEQARSMAEVAQEPTVRVLADTPDKAVVWGVALGLHQQVGEVLAREMADPQMRAAAQSSGSYYPMWIGSSFAGDSGGGGGGSLFSGSGTPDVGGMLGTIGSVGSAPASSSSGGGGFGGGGGGGGGGGSSGF